MAECSSQTLLINSEATTKSKKLSFREFVIIVKPDYKWYRHCVELANTLQQVADGKIKRLMVFMPPRHGKSELVSRLFPAYCLYLYPERWYAITSYAADLAYTLSRAARHNYNAIIGDGAFGDTSAVKHWETGKGGGLWATGMGGPATGKGYHGGITDDPNKNAEEAQSVTVQNGQQEWYDSVWSTRAEPDAWEIFVETRWNEEDLAAYVLSKAQEEEDEEEEVEGTERWTICCFDAIKAEQPPTFPANCDLLSDWRQTGDALCPERYPLNRLLKFMRRLGTYWWNALYQQNPQPRAGDMLQRTWYEIVGNVPSNLVLVRYWDKAGTQDDGCYTAGVLMGRERKAESWTYVLDVVRGQWSKGTREATMRQTAFLDHQTWGARVEIWVEQEPADAGKESAQASIANLSGFHAYAETASGDKVVRAGPFAAQSEALNVKLLKGDWNKAYLDELSAFPKSKIKDQVDASSGAFNKIWGVSYGGAMPITSKENKRPIPTRLHNRR